MGVAALEGTPIFLIQKFGATYNLPSPTSTAPPSPSSEGLSTGAKIAVGVCVPRGTIIIVVIAFIWWHRRRKPQKAPAASSSRQYAEPDLGPYTGKPELEAAETVKPYFKQELDAGNEIQPGRPDAPAELPVLETPERPVAELAAANRSTDTSQAELPGEGTLAGRISSKLNPDAASLDGDAGQRSSSIRKDTNV